MRIVTLLVSLGALTISLIGGAKIVLDIFDEGLTNNLEGLWAKVIALGLACLFGWLVAILCIRVYGNLISPLIIQAYAWLCLARVGVL